MGIYVNPGNTAFRKILNSDIYIDKTNLISATNARIDKHGKNFIAIGLGQKHMKH